MNMNIFKQSAVLLKDNLMVMQPLFIWALVTMLVAMPLSAKRGMDIGFIFSLSIVVLCFIAFLSGWYNCIKATVANKSKVYETPEEKNKAQIEILKNFFPGVGEYILPTGLAAILYGGISYGIFVLYKYLAIQTFIGAKIPNELIKLMGTGTQEQVTKFVQTLSPEQLGTLSGIMIGGFVVYFLFEILILWFAPTLFYTTKNPIMALFKAIMFTFKNLFASITIVVVMCLINMLISFTNVLLGNNFLAIIPMLLSFMYIVYYVLTVFLYYEQAQNNSIIGSQLDRQV